jgi:signal transduction histidine kinase
MSEQLYQHEETRQLVHLVTDAAELISGRGEAAFDELRVAGSRWRQEETYIFVLDPDGNMRVHPDPALEGRNTLDLKDVAGKPIVRGLIDAATGLPDKPEGWYHYQWPVPGGLLPRWKSSYVRRVTAPSGSRYVVGCGVYNDRMERAFVVDAVRDAAGQIEKLGVAAFPRFHDPTGPFIAKDAYIFVFDSRGIDLVNPGFPNLEGRNLLDLKDSQGKRLVREMFDVVQSRGSGWVDYMWPKPGESVATQKSAFVSKAKLGDGDRWVLVGCGVYLADAPTAAASGEKLSAAELMALVRDGAAVFAQQGERAYPQFRERGSRWFRDDTYFFVWAMDGARVFHAASPAGEGDKVADMRDILGRPTGRMILDAANSAPGEGWIHYMYPAPDSIFPVWKSTFVKRVTFPSGTPYAVGCGVYNMRMDRAFIEDVVESAARLVEQRGPESFAALRDRSGPFVFMDTYVFVLTPDGIERVNAAFPSLEGKHVIDLKDLKGKPVIRDEIDAAMKQGRAWVELYWYKPGHNTPARKETFVRQARFGPDIYIVGSGIYSEA